tara:strand:- start:5079 stop:5792 length:714 start_codon:yes stop_codon:yes gene_type:complete
MYLLSQGKIRNVIINDIDPVIHSFWWSTLNDTQNFIDMIKNTPVTMDEWRRQREIVIEGDARNITQLGFAGFFLNRTNRSGIIKGGVIGGKKQEGKYKINARYNPDGLAKRVANIAQYRDRIALENLDAIELINNLNPDNQQNSIVYLDPPYYKKGGQLYRNYYDHGDHENVAQEVQQLDCPWVVTYDNCEEIRELYEWSSSTEFSLHYSTHLKRPIGKEVCFYGNMEFKTQPYLKR